MQLSILLINLILHQFPYKGAEVQSVQMHTGVELQL